MNTEAAIEVREFVLSPELKTQEQLLAEEVNNFIRKEILWSRLVISSSILMVLLTAVMVFLVFYFDM